MESAETVLAAIPQGNLADALTMFHRGGFGHVIRVLDPQRAPLPGQLNRAGVQGAKLGRVAEGEVLLLVHAPARTGQAIEIALRCGATDTEVVSRERSVADAVAPGLISVAGERRGRRGGSRRSSPQPPAPRPAPADEQVAD